MPGRKGKEAAPSFGLSIPVWGISSRRGLMEQNPGNAPGLPNVALPHQLIKMGPSQSDEFAGRLRA